MGLKRLSRQTNKMLDTLKQKYPDEYYYYIDEARIKKLKQPQKYIAVKRAIDKINSDSPINSSYKIKFNFKNYNIRKTGRKNRTFKRIIEQRKINEVI